VHRPQHEAGPADPIGQCRAIQIDALPGVDLSLPVQRKMIGVFGDQNLRHSRLGRQSALDQPCRRGRLDHYVFASPAGVFRPAHHQHAELGGHDVKTFARILPNAMQRLAATWAGLVIDIDHHLDARQVRRQRSPLQATLGRPACPLGRIGRINLGLITRRILLDIFEPEQHLVFGQCLGTPPKAMTLQLLDDLTEPIVLRPLRNQHRFERAWVVRKCICGDRHHGSRSCVALRRERFQHADSLGRNHAGCIEVGVSRAA
jgi:hypothetical protein